ncbi:MAG TPA: hypothetical protein VIN06_01525 [Devosia sp.]
MTTTTWSSRRTAGSPYFSAGFWGVMVVILTTVHHAWGAYIYETPWRLDIVYVAVPVAAGFVALLVYAVRREGLRAGRWSAWIAVLLIIGFCTLAIGVYEGGYNHLLKNIVYFSAGPVSWMFPDGATGIPDDIFFELTGVAQLVVGLVAGSAAWRLARTLRS